VTARKTSKRAKSTGGKPKFPFKFPPKPPEGAPMQETLRWAIGVMEVSLKTTAANSPRMKAIDSLIRFCRNAIAVLDRQDMGDLPLRTVAIVLEARDQARAEQRWIDEWIAFEKLDQGVLDAVQFYKMQLARVEATSMVAISFIGTDREADPATGGWWSQIAGKAVVDVIGVAPMLVALPEDSEEYATWKAAQK